MVIEQLDCFVLGLAQYRFGTVYVFSEPSMLYHKFDLSTWLKKKGTNASRSGKRPEKTIKKRHIQRLRRHLQLEISQILLFFCRIRPSKWKQ